MSSDQVTQLIQVAQGDRSSDILAGPKLTAFSGKTVQFRSTAKRPFVVDVASESENDAIPQVKEVEEGTSLVARADVCEDGAIDLALQFDAIQISEVETRSKNLPTREVKVQVPETQSCKIQLASHLQNGETLAIWCDKLNTTKERKRTVRKWYGTSWTAVARESTPLLLMVTPRVIEVEDVAK